MGLISNHYSDGIDLCEGKVTQKSSSFSSKFMNLMGSVKSIASASFSSADADSKRSGSRDRDPSVERKTVKMQESHLSEKLEELNREWLIEKAKGTERSQQKMLRIANRMATLIGHMGGTEFQKSNHRLDDELMEIVLKIQKTYNNKLEKAFTVASLVVSIVGVACVFPSAIDGINRGIATARGIPHTPMSGDTIKMLAAGSQAMGPVSQALSSVAGVCGKTSEADRIALQHRQQVIQHAIEAHKASKQKAHESSQSSSQANKAADDALNRAVESTTRVGG